MPCRGSWSPTLRPPQRTRRMGHPRIVHQRIVILLQGRSVGCAAFRSSLESANDAKLTFQRDEYQSCSGNRVRWAKGVAVKKECSLRGLSSRPVEFHHQPLTKPCLRLSPHTAFHSDQVVSLREQPLSVEIRSEEHT